MRRTPSEIEWLLNGVADEDATRLQPSSLRRPSNAVWRVGGRDAQRRDVATLWLPGTLDAWTKDCAALVLLCDRVHEPVTDPLAKWWTSSNEETECRLDARECWSFHGMRRS